MLKQINIIEALKRYMKDDEVKILVPKNGYDADDWENLEAMYLGQYLENVIFLADGPPKHVREETVKSKDDEIVFPDEPPIDTDDTEPADIAPDVLPVEYVEDPFEEEEFDPDMEELEADMEKLEPEQMPKKKTGPKKDLDLGKIRALFEAHRSIQWIADDMVVSYKTIKSRLEEMGLI